MDDKLKQYRGCLTHLRTEKGRRRYPGEGTMGHTSFLIEDSGFVKDEVRLFCSKAFRRMSGKTQVVSFPLNPLITQQDPRRVLDPICDFIEKLGVMDPLLAVSLMTDADVSYLGEQHMLDIGHIRNTAVGELIEPLKGKSIDCCDPDLDW